MENEPTGSDDWVFSVLQSIEDYIHKTNRIMHDMEERWKRSDERWQRNDERWQRNDERWQKNDERWERNDARLRADMQVLRYLIDRDRKKEG